MSIIQVGKAESATFWRHFVVVRDLTTEYPRLRFPFQSYCGVLVAAQLLISTNCEDRRWGRNNCPPWSQL